MSNKTQLQTNNIEYASLIQTLRGKAAGGSGEDVTEETSAYTTKIGQLESAVAALETELEGKASGGAGGGSVETCTLVVNESLRGTILYLIYQENLGDFVKITADPLTSAAGTYTAVCGTMLYVPISSSADITVTNLESVLNGKLYLITAKAGETAILSVV